MKKFIFSIALLGGLTFLTVQTAEAQQNKPKNESAVQPQTAQLPQKPASPTRPGFVDADGDGICDNYDGTRPGRGLGPSYGQGQTVQNANCPFYGQAVQNGSGKGMMRAGQGIRARDGSGPRCIFRTTTK